MTTKKKNKGGAGNLGKRFRKIEVPYKGEIKFYTQGLFRYDGKELPLIRGKRAERKTLCKLSDLAKFPVGRARTEELDRLWAEKLAELQKSGKGKVEKPENFTFGELTKLYRKNVLHLKKDAKNTGRRIAFWEKHCSDHPVDWMKDGRSQWPSEIIRLRGILERTEWKPGHYYLETTVNRHLEILRFIFSYAVGTLEWTDLNPVKRPKILLKVNKSRNERTRSLGDMDTGLEKDGEGEKDRLFNACRESESPDLWDQLRFSLWIGCRDGAMESLRWQDVNLKTGTIRFSERKNEIDQEVDISLNPDLMTMLRERKLRSPGMKRKKDGARYVYVKTDLVFPAKVKTAWNTARVKAGIAPENGPDAVLKWHDLRHTFATTLRRLGVPIDDIMHSTGHASRESVLRYAHIDQETSRNNLGKVAQALKIS